VGNVKINALEVENLKRVKAVRLDCTGQALTVIGGANGEGKTSVLDAIAYALGGERYRPSKAERDGSLVPPEIKVTLSNGIVVERKGKNCALKVTDPQGNRGGQKLLDAFVHQFALDLPKFLNASAREKAETLLQVIGVGEELARLEQAEQRIYSERHATGQIADRKQKFADELPAFADAPYVPVTAAELIREQQEILARNGENQRKRQRVDRLAMDLKAIDGEVASLRGRLAEAEKRQAVIAADYETASKSASELEDASTAEIEQRLAEIDETNAKVRANLDKAKAIEDAASHRKQYDELTARLDETRREKTALLDGADLPMPGLSVAEGALFYRGQPWDGMSGAEQLQVATAIVRRLNPDCGFVLLDKLEQMDLRSLRQFGDWLESEGLQAIATRVSTGDECSIIIEDGTGTLTAPDAKPKFVPGSF
jgi:hypothetical protein